VIEKRADLLARQGPGKPLHIVLHEDLHGRAPDGTSSLDRHVHATADRHMGAQKNFRLLVFDLRFGLA
jgi:hypothetical protein